MSYPVYYVPAGDVLPVLFDSFDGGTGGAITMTWLAVTDIEIYKDGGITQRASDAGYILLDTDGIDFDGITGIHGFSIDTGDNTDAGFYTVGAWFHVVVSAVTIDAQTVNFIACAFRLMAAEGVAGKPKVDVDAWLGPAAATPTVAGVPEVDLTHIAGDAQSGIDLKDFADAGYDPATNKVQGVVLVDTLTTYTGNTVQTGDSFGRIGAAGAGLTAVPWNAAWDAEVESEVADGLAVYDPPTNTEMVAAFTEIKGATWSAVTDTMELIRDKLTDIETDTAEIGAAGAGLTNINLPNQTMDIVGNITGNLSGSVGSVTGAVGSVTAGVTVANGGIATTSFAAGAIDAASLSADAGNELADAFLNRNMATGTDSGTDSTAVRTPRQALRALRNKVAVVVGTATITKEDDTTASWTTAIATTAGNPISSSDPT